MAVLPLLLFAYVMSSSDDEGAVIAHAQREARDARASASSTAGPSAVETPRLQSDGQPRSSSSAGGRRRTCLKDDLTIVCNRCSNRPTDKRKCAYQVGEWDPPATVDNATSGRAEPLSDVAAEPPSTEMQKDSERRTRNPPEFLDPGEFWRRELPATAARRAKSSQLDKGLAEGSAELAAQLAELETTLVTKLRAAEARVEQLEGIQHRAAEEKRQKTMKSFLAPRSRGLPTRAAHFDKDLTNATGYSESELRRTFRKDVAAVEAFIEDRVSDPLKQLQLADAVDRRFHSIRTTLAAKNLAAKYVLESLQNFSATLYHRYNGRDPNDVRAAQQGAATRNR